MNGSFMVRQYISNLNTFPSNEIAKEEKRNEKRFH